MSLNFYWYPKCGTCRNAKKWLEDRGKEINEIHIVEETPTKEEIKDLYEKSGLELRKFFNTSGMKYRELNLKEKLYHMSEDEQLELLTSDGMLLKRPITTDGEKVTVGFKEDQFEKYWM
ncbi:arsenate reductase family protein [Bacillus amyloliquefaciens]|uniref:arsenate reductase family protein n=1 Tax=Bacillus amyloliquefaciens TaxID=1390 RepID=UPI0022B07451|nr:arsenate reductase family protein [Bacillus amyloliquefaciens]MCZ4248137.1 arsenate reductase family protein [Bacillus amyloliquefaciens]